MSMIITFLTIALFCFTFVYWLKKSENKYKYDKAKMVDLFIRRNNINVTNIYIGSYFDLVNDAKNKSIWFFYLRQNTLQYKSIPYDDLFQVEYKLDGTTVNSFARTGKLKRDLVVGNDTGNVSSVIENTNIFLDKNFRVKEVMLTILIDELKPITLDFVFISSHLPIELKNIKDSDVKEWYYLLQEIIKKEDKMAK